MNSDQSPMRLFNKPSDAEWGQVEFPDFFYHDTGSLWVPVSEMSAEELASCQTHETTGGYVKVIGYKDGWRKAWNSATGDDKRKVLSLPNWDNSVFMEITGIDAEAELADNTRELTVADVEKLLGHKVKIVKDGK